MSPREALIELIEAEIRQNYNMSDLDWIYSVAKAVRKMRGGGRKESEGGCRH